MKKQLCGLTVCLCLSVQSAGLAATERSAQNIPCVSSTCQQALRLITIALLIRDVVKMRTKGCVRQTQGGLWVDRETWSMIAWFEQSAGHTGHSASRGCRLFPGRNGPNELAGLPLPTCFFWTSWGW